MNDYTRIERLIQEARVQRSAALGMMIGEFLADSWLLAARLTRKALVAVRGPKPAGARTEKTVPAR